MKGRLRAAWTIFLFLSVLTIGLLGGILIDRQVLTAFAQSSPPAESGPDMRLFGEAWQTIQKFYVDRSAIKPTTLTYGAISGMVDALGDTGHSSFLSPEMVKQENNYTRGEFEGIGAQVEKKDDHIVIVAPMDDSPALRAGLKPGDIILKVNGEDVTGQSLDQVVGKILGPAGTTVTITVQTPSNGETRDLTITRARIQVRNVTWAPIPGTKLADVRIVGFSNGVTDDLKKALDEISKGGYSGVVFDLRNNPGGLLSEAVGTASQFLKTGNVLLEKDAQGKIQSVGVNGNPSLPDMPMVILINNGTASASEIVSGALQDYKRATLVGVQTFGTGTVLNQFGLSDGSALLLATQEWLTPNGRVIWHQGIAPDYVVTVDPAVVPVVPNDLKSMTPDQVHSNKDDQLNKAIELLDPSFDLSGKAQDDKLSQ